MDKSKLDIKTILIFLMGIAIILILVFMDKPYDYSRELKELKQENDNLFNYIENIREDNNKIEMRIDSIKLELINKDNQLKSNSNEIKRLKQKRNEIPVYINNIDSDSLTSVLTNYLNTKRR